MDTQKQRVKGHIEEAKGSIKEGIGRASGNEKLEAEGVAEGVKGSARKEAAKSTERTKGDVENAVGAIEEKAGAILGDERMQREGKLKEAKGDALKALNR
jgi:uncharacterized protein YjbJ (UPF0337 family)